MILEHADGSLCIVASMTPRGRKLEVNVVGCKVSLQLLGVLVVDFMRNWAISSDAQLCVQILKCFCNGACLAIWKSFCQDGIRVVIVNHHGILAAGCGFNEELDCLVGSSCLFWLVYGGITAFGLMVWHVALRDNIGVRTRFWFGAALVCPFLVQVTSVHDDRLRRISFQRLYQQSG